jgi:hypothetical protein
MLGKDVKFKTKGAMNGESKVKGGPEFVLANCGSQYFEFGDMQPRFDKDVFYRTKRFMMNQKNALAPDRPLRIIHLVVDSFSRRHFFRKMNRTVEFLNKLNTGDEFRVFDFKIHNVRGADSIRNQIWVFGDKWPTKTNRLRDNVGSDSMWQYMKENGFVTMMGLES